MFSALTSHIIQTFMVYGLPAICGIVFIASAGVPLPTSLLLLTAGAFASQGHYPLVAVIVLAVLAAVAGDHVAYFAGWMVPRRTLNRIGCLIGRTSLRRARVYIRRQGWGAVFFSRWLLTPLGAPCSLVCGHMAYPLHTFFTADLIGETIYVSVLIMLGYWFADQIGSIMHLLGVIGPATLLVAAAIWGGWMLTRVLRRSYKVA